MLYTVQFVKYTSYQQEPEQVLQEIKFIDAIGPHVALEKVLQFAPKKYDVIYIIPLREVKK